jgi:hypothetical protein
MISLHPCSIFLLVNNYDIHIGYKIASSSGIEVWVTQGISYADALGGVYLDHSLEKINSSGVKRVVRSLYFLEFGEGGLKYDSFTLKLGR